MEDQHIKDLRRLKMSRSIATALAAVLAGAEPAFSVEQLVIHDDRGGTGQWKITFMSAEDDVQFQYEVAQGTLEAERV